MPSPTDPSGGGEALAPAEGNPPATAAVDQAPATANAEATSADAPAAPLAAETKGPAAKSGHQPFDFRQPIFLAPADLRRLRLRHEEFIRSLSARLSIYLRLEFALSLTRLHTVSYRQFTESLPKPAHVTLFKAEPLRGIGLLEIPRALGMSIVDRLLGGPPQCDVTEHAFSEIETALLDQVMQLILAEWCNQWAGIQALQPTLLGHEDDGRFLKTAPHDTVMLVVVMEAKIGDSPGQMQLALPCHALEPFVRQLTPPADPPPADPRLALAALRWNRGFDDVQVPVTAMWNDLQLTARQIANLKPGDVLPLDSDCTRRVKLRLADQAKFEGNLGTTNGKWAVAVTGMASPSADNQMTEGMGQMTRFESKQKVLPAPAGLPIPTR